MPPRITNTVVAGGYGYQNPFHGPASHTGTVNVNVPTLSSVEVDADGYLKPGLPLAADGTLVGAAEAVFGVVLEPIKVAASNAAGDLAAGLAAHPVAIPTIGQVIRDACEYNLGRVLNANEIAGFSLAGSTLKLLD